MERSPLSPSSSTAEMASSSSPPSSFSLAIPPTEFNVTPTPPPPPRVLNHVDREQRLTVAQQLRAANLQSTSRRCAQHVQRAAAVAKAVAASRKNLADIKKRQSSLNLQNAQVRRKRLLKQKAALSQLHQAQQQRIPKPVSAQTEFQPVQNKLKNLSITTNEPPKRIVPPACVPLETKRAAINAISSYFLLHRARRMLEACGVLGERITSYTFSEISTVLGTPMSHKGAALMLRAVANRRPLAAPSSVEDARSRKNQRLLLSCLLIALKPFDTLHDFNAADEKQNSTLALTTLRAARRLLLCMHVGSLDALVEAYKIWVVTFTEWRKRDSEKMLSSLVEEAINIKNMTTSVNEEFKRLERVQHMKSNIGGSSQEGAAGKNQLLLHGQTKAAWQAQMVGRQEKIRGSVSKLAGAHGLRRLDMAMSAAEHAQDERTVHEILIDLPGLLERIRNPTPVSPEVWLILKKELSMNPPVNDTLAACLSQIEHSLNSMTPNSFSLATDSPAQLDVDFAASLVFRAADALSKSQAEAFDTPLQEWVGNAVKRLRSGGSNFVDTTIDVLRELTELINSVKSEIMMYRVRYNSPIVQQYGASWERLRFQEHISAKKFSKRLPKTTMVLAKALQSASQQVRVSSVKSNSAIRGIILKAIVDMMVRPTMWTESEMPEIFHLDHDRVVRMQNDAQRCSLICSVDIIGRQFLRSRGVHPRPGNLKELITVTALESCSLMDIQDTFVTWTRQKMESNRKSMTEEDVEFVRNMVTRTTRADNQMFSILQSRVEKAVLELAEKMATSQSRTFSSSSGASNLCHRQKSLEGSDSLIRSLARRVCALGIHTILIHSEPLVNIIKLIDVSPCERTGS